jgi:flagellar biosynthesis protein FlhA
MPGQQMSIDADLNMGFIDQAEAQRRRKVLEKQSGFYGSMDGASKFVKGDAIAGIIILLINIVGGLIIGVMQKGMAWDQALHTYTLLTVGDGIVTQIPALVIAVGTGIIVTRSSSDTDLSGEVMRQLTSFPKVVWLVVFAIAALVFLPGIPAVPVILVVAVLVAFGVFAQMRAKSPEETAAAQADAPAGGDTSAAPAVPKIEPIDVRIAPQLAELAEGEASVFLQRVAAFRAQFATELGLLLPAVRFAVDTKLAAHAYEISIYGVVHGRGEVMPDRTLAIHPSGDTKLVQGVETREPTYGLPAVWIEGSERDKARAARYTLVDAPTVFITHLSETLRQHCASLVTRAEADKLLNRVRESQPGLVEEVVPSLLSVIDIQKVLQSLLREKVGLRNVDAILETLADVGRSTKDAALLTEAVRQRLGAAICQQLMGETQTLQVLTLDPVLESRLRASTTDQASLAVDPRLVEQMLSRIVGQAEQMMRSNLLPVLLCAPDLRRHVRSLTERAVPHMRVLAVTEVPNTVPLKAFGSVTVPSLPT